MDKSQKSLAELKQSKELKPLSDLNYSKIELNTILNNSKDVSFQFDYIMFHYKDNILYITEVKNCIWIIELTKYCESNKTKMLSYFSKNIFNDNMNDNMKEENIFLNSFSSDILKYDIFPLLKEVPNKYPEILY